MTDWQRADRPRRRIAPGIEGHATIGSTNDRARALLDEPGGEGRVVVTDEQTAGRGRRGRSWVSPPGRNLMMSVAIRPRLAAADGWQLGMAAGLAARAACAPRAAVGLKWPNDLVAADGAKLGGLLLETAVDGERITSAVIGIGINVNWPRAEMPPEIADAATSLAELAGGPMDRVELLAALLDALDHEVIALEAGVSPLDRYRQACVTIGTLVGVETGDGRIEGLAAAIDAQGTLVVETAAGAVVLSSGEIRRLRAVATA
jgi:BirA family transcriptional regulator, biotin operon repressor / biotin---[acetyl-CoA-carboxylase] ligase